MYKVVHIMIILMIVSIIDIYQKSLIQFIKSYKINQAKNEIKVVHHIDYKKYSGLWYEVASVQTKERKKVKMIFQIHQNNSMQITHSYYHSGKKYKEIEEVTVQPTLMQVTNAKLKRNLLSSNSKIEEWIIKISEEYYYSVVCSADYSIFKIYFREPIQTQKSFHQFVKLMGILKQQGYNLQNLVMIDQK